MKTKQLFQCVLLLGVLLSSIWYTAGAVYSGRPPMPEPDTLIYLQYASNMAEGHAFEYIQGDLPSTGSTSYLYVSALALLHKMGFAGDRLLTASFCLNGLFYLISIVLTGLIARKLAPRYYPVTLLAMTLSGQTLYTFFGQTDMGLLATWVLFCLWALLFERKFCLLAGVILAGLTHPTAAAPIGGLIATGLLYEFIRRKTDASDSTISNRQLIWIGGAGVVAIATTLLFNYILTGEFIFMSLRPKGLLKTYPVLGALNIALLHAVQLIRELFLGIDSSSARSLYFFPLLTGLSAIGGLLTRPWNNMRSSRFDAFVVLSVLAEIVLLSTNETQGISHDRYMAWIFPLFYIYVAVFLERLRQTRFPKSVAPALATALLLFQPISLSFFTSKFLMASHSTASVARFATEILNNTQPGDALMMQGGAGILWNLPDRKLMNTQGIFTPECAKGRHWLCYVETLKYHPELQAPYWLITQNAMRGDVAHKYLTGDSIIKDSDNLTEGARLELYHSDWSALAIRQPVTEKNWTLKNQVDIGYHVDETRSNYKMTTRLRGIKIQPHVQLDEKLHHVEVGQMILGSEEFTLSNITPNSPLHVVLRTAKSAEFYIANQLSVNAKEFNLSSSIQLIIKVDGHPVEVAIELQDEGFTDAQFTLPASFITTPNPSVEVIGDHLSYGYWLYQ